VHDKRCGRSKNLDRCCGQLLPEPFHYPGADEWIGNMDHQLIACDIQA
jgi:hypothetical protein